MSADRADRLTALESRVAYQDRTIEELNAALTAQWRGLDALAREVAALTDRLADLSRHEAGAPEPLPPHY